LGESVDQLTRTLDASMAEGDTRFVINLAEVPMIDSSGIGLLVRFLAATKRHGGSLKLVSPSSFAEKTLRMVGVLRLFEIFQDDERAVESFT
jgi:anti-anti-sigma factor